MERLEFDESYFQEEEREGFVVAPMMKKTWAAQLEVLSEFDKVCRAHDIRYFADWGTLLGAVRHHGFIPWDDDIDIAMLRPDYMKFLSVASELPAGYEVVNPENDKDWANLVQRVINSRILEVNEERLWKYHGCPYVVGLDIDVLDYVPRNADEDHLLLKMVYIVLKSVGAEEEYRAGKCSFEKMHSFLAQIEDLCGVPIDYSRPLAQQLRVLADRLCMLYNDEDADYVQFIPSRITNRPNYIIPKEHYAKTLYVPFENIEMPIPAGYDGILRLMYGDDYMTPARKGCGHEYPFYQDQERMLKEKMDEEHSPLSWYYYFNMERLL